MKIFQTILMCLFICSCSSIGNFSKQTIYSDQTGAIITEEEFQEQQQNKEYALARWDYLKDEKRHAQLSAPVHERYILSYDSMAGNLEKMTGKDFEQETIFLIEYNYLDDLCTSQPSNNLNTSTIKKRKAFLDPQKQSIEENYKNVVFLSFFEQGISLANDPESEKEYFYRDMNNFLRNTIFKDPSTCGSYALLKPNGQVLIRNGEHRADWMAQLLTSENWSLFFPEEE